jgi:hypothetical protein
VDNRAWWGIVLLGAVGCSWPTEFTGEPKVAGGPAGCARKCAAWNMDLAGMVAMGEFSDGCICRVRTGKPPAAQPAPKASDPAAPAAPVQPVPSDPAQPAPGGGLDHAINGAAQAAVEVMRQMRASKEQARDHWEESYR